MHKCSRQWGILLWDTVVGLSSEGHNEADRSECRKLLGSFGNVKTLRIGSGLNEVTGTVGAYIS